MRRQSEIPSAKARAERITVGSKRGMCWAFWIAAVFAAPCAAAFGLPPAADADGNGYLDQRDYVYFGVCLMISGPGREPLFSECVSRFDGDGDRDIDLRDFGGLAVAVGHLPIPLRDRTGSVITVQSTEPYDGRSTCAGSCHAHDVEHIVNGLHFQQGRTKTDGQLDMGEDIFGDGRWWNFSRGRYGRWATGLDVTSKNNTDPREIGNTSFAWIRDCGGCHVGGGPGEVDRDGLRYYDYSTARFGYEELGKTWEDVRLDGDYTVLDTVTGEVIAAPWDRTGLSGPDCLFCHRADRTMQGATSMNLTWRQATLAAGAALVDAAGQPVRAFEAAGTAAQGWYSTLTIQSGKATVLQIDYGRGVTGGSLLADGVGHVSLAPASFRGRPTDEACAPCHAQTLRASGPWFDEGDIHFAKLNNRRDADPANDIPNNRSNACNFCHPGNPAHNFAKGNFPGKHWRDDLDWVDFRSCRDCHLADSPVRHPDAPPLPGNLAIHVAMWDYPDVLSCEACHITYGPTSHAAFDSSVTAAFTTLPASLFYSADPLDPTNPDKSRWYPNLILKTDSDGKQRLFPGGTKPYVYWADWDQNGTPEDLSDDTIAPVVAPQMRLLTGGVALPGVTDDNGDGRTEINRPGEILLYIEYLKGGNPQQKVLATRPVLVKGLWVWYEDPQGPGGVNSFNFENRGIAMETWRAALSAMDHFVRPAEQAWGYSPTGTTSGCADCHRPATHDSPVFDRKILVDPYDATSQPVYMTVRELTGLNPP